MEKIVPINNGWSALFCKCGRLVGFVHCNGSETLTCAICKTVYVQDSKTGQITIVDKTQGQR